MPEPSILSVNVFSVLKDEPLYDIPLNLNISAPVSHPERRFCISAVAIESPNAQLEPAPEPETVISKTPRYKGQTFVKLEPKNLDLEPATTHKPIRLPVKLVSSHAKMPTRGSEGAAGHDLHSCEDVLIPARTRKLVDSGISVAIPVPKLYGRVAPRSGLSVKGLDVGAGVIDSDYCGTIKVLLINNSDTPF